MRLLYMMWLNLVVEGQPMTDCKTLALSAPWASRLVKCALFAATVCVKDKLFVDVE